MLKIDSPTLLVNEKIVVENILRMQQKAKLLNASFRPHFKTHQSHYFGEFFRREGISKIAVSSLKMAEYFVEKNWNDILVAFPVNLLEIERINIIVAQINLSVFAEEDKVLKTINAQLTHPLGVYLKIDIGYGRTGIAIENTDKILSLVRLIQNSSKLQFRGFGIHAGQSYRTFGKENLVHLAKNLEQKLLKFRAEMDKHQLVYEISFGDTPLLSTISKFEGLDEIRPGNFIFYDAMQYNLGTCQFSNIAVSLAAPVVAKHCERNEIVIYAGAIHLSKEYILNTNGEKSYGLLSKFENNKWTKPIKNVYIKNLSQEHAIVHLPSEECNKIWVGDVLSITPVHSCLTANLMGKYLSLTGKNIQMFRYQ